MDGAWLMFEEVNMDKITEILEKDRKEKAAPRKKKASYNLTDRSATNWFTLPTHYGKCSNPNCTDPRGHDTAMVFTYPDTGVDICRFCWKEGYGLSAAA